MQRTRQALVDRGRLGALIGAWSREMAKMGKMGKNSKKELRAKLTEADTALHHLESTRAALSEELRAERDRHAEETAALRREHEQALDEIERSAHEEMSRAGEQLAEARAALEKATEENSRLTADLRDRDDRARTLLQELEGSVEAALGQLSGALTQIRGAAPDEHDRYRSLDHTQGV